MAERGIAVQPGEATSQLCASLCAAFADDPGLSWIWPDRADRLTRLPHLFDAILAGTLLNGSVFRTPGSEAVALWRKPGRIDPDEQELCLTGPRASEAFRSGHERAQLMSTILKAHRPADCGWYLQFIGVHPDAQRGRLGSAVMQAGFDLARADGAAAYVEVMNPANLGFYRRAGFEIVSEFDLPDAGPHVWAMLARAS